MAIDAEPGTVPSRTQPSSSLMTPTRCSVVKLQWPGAVRRAGLGRVGRRRQRVELDAGRRSGPSRRTTRSRKTVSFCTSTSGSAVVCSVTVGSCELAGRVAHRVELGPRRVVGGDPLAARPAASSSVSVAPGRHGLDQRALLLADPGGVVGLVVAGGVAADPLLDLVAAVGAVAERGEDRLGAGPDLRLDRRPVVGLGLGRRVDQRGGQQDRGDAVLQVAAGLGDRVVGALPVLRRPRRGWRSRSA